MITLLIPIADTTYVVLCKTNKKTIQASLILVDMLYKEQVYMHISAYD